MRQSSLVMALCFASLCNAAWCSNNSDSWRLSTDDTVLVVSVEAGVPVIKQLNSTNADRNWLVEPIPEILFPAVLQQGAELKTQWRYDGGVFDRKSGQLVLRFSNDTPALQLQSIWQARPGRGPIEHWLTVLNRSGSPITVGHQDSLVLSHLAIPQTSQWTPGGSSVVLKTQPPKAALWCRR